MDIRRWKRRKKNKGRNQIEVKAIKGGRARGEKRRKLKNGKKK